MKELFPFPIIITRRNIYQSIICLLFIAQIGFPGNSIHAQKSLMGKPSRAGLQTPGYILDMAFHYYNKKDYNKAIIYFERYIKLVGDQEVPLRYLGKIQLKLKRPDLAIDYLNRGHKANSKSIETLHLLGEVYLGQNDLKKAIPVYEQILELQPADIGSLYTLAQIYQSRKNHRKTYIYYKKLATSIRKNGGFNPLLYKAYVTLASYHYNKQEYNKSLMYYKNIHRLNPDDFNSAFILAELYRVNGQFEKSIPIMKKLLIKDPDNISVLESIVEMLFIVKSPDLITYYAIYMRHAEKIDGLFHAIGEYIKKNDKRALQLFATLSKKNKNRLSIRIGIYRTLPKDKIKSLAREALMCAVLAQRIKAYDLSLQYAGYSHAYLGEVSNKLFFKDTFFQPKKDPLKYSDSLMITAESYIQLYMYHGTTLERKKQFKAALSYYLRAIEISKHLEKWVKVNKKRRFKNRISAKDWTEEIHRRMSTLLISSGWIVHNLEDKSYFKAENLIKQSIKLIPNDSRNYFLMGIIYLKKGQKDKKNYAKAQTYLNKAIKYYTKNSKSETAPGDFYFYLGIVHEKKKDYAAMETNLIKALKVAPYNSLYLNYLGYMYSIQNKNLKQAYKFIKTALEDDPENEAYLDTLGWILYKMQKYDEALGHLLYAKSKSEKKNLKDAVIVYHIAETYFRLGQSTMAHKYYVHTLEIINHTSEPLDKLYINQQIIKTSASKEK